MSCYFGVLYIQSFMKGLVMPGYDDKCNNLIN